MYTYGRLNVEQEDLVDLPIADSQPAQPLRDRAKADCPGSSSGQDRQPAMPAAPVKRSVVQHHTTDSCMIVNTSIIIINLNTSTDKISCNKPLMCPELFACCTNSLVHISHSNFVMYMHTYISILASLHVPQIVMCFASETSRLRTQYTQRLPSKD